MSLATDEPAGNLWPADDDTGTGETTGALVCPVELI
jgi:hypothetical protein